MSMKCAITFSMYVTSFLTLHHDDRISMTGNIYRKDFEDTKWVIRIRKLKKDI